VAARKRSRLDLPEAPEEVVERVKKEEIVETLRGVFESTNLVVVTQFVGLSVAEASDLRRQMRAAGATFRVTKNRLAKRAVADTPFSALTDMFTGSSAIAFSDDPVAAARVAVTYAKGNDKLVVVGGALAGEPLDAARVKTLAELPSLDVLRGRLIGMLNTPATRIASILQAPGGQLARVVNAYSEKGEAA
jgi:large subunit ribosomal protein L10